MVLDVELETSAPSRPVFLSLWNRRSPIPSTVPPSFPSLVSREYRPSPITSPFSEGSVGSGIFWRMIYLIAGNVTFLKPTWMAKDLSKP